MVKDLGSYKHAFEKLKKLFLNNSWALLQCSTPAIIVSFIFINIFLKTLWQFLVPLKPIKLLRSYFQWKLQDVFVMLVVVVLHHRRFFISGLLFYATGTPHWLPRSVKVSTSSELYLDYFRQFSFVNGQFVSFYYTRNNFERAFFLLHAFSTFWHIFTMIWAR